MLAGVSNRRPKVSAWPSAYGKANYDNAWFSIDRRWQTLPRRIAVSKARHQRVVTVGGYGKEVCEFNYMNNIALKWVINLNRRPLVVVGGGVGYISKWKMSRVSEKR
jgi:hypothetical protein